MNISNRVLSQIILNRRIFNKMLSSGNSSGSVYKLLADTSGLSAGTIKSQIGLYGGYEIYKERVLAAEKQEIAQELPFEHIIEQETIKKKCSILLQFARDKDINLRSTKDLSLLENYLLDKLIEKENDSRTV
jgi:hypothetical protein